MEIYATLPVAVENLGLHTILGSNPVTCTQQPCITHSNLSLLFPWASSYQVLLSTTLSHSHYPQVLLDLQAREEHSSLLGPNQEMTCIPFYLNLLDSDWLSLALLAIGGPGLSNFPDGCFSEASL